MAFADIPVRENGQKFFADWFNTIRTAGIALESFLGTGFIPQGTATIANGQAVAADVSGLLLDSSDYLSALIMMEVHRTTATSERMSMGFVKALYRSNSGLWELIDELGGDDDGVVFTVTAAGQVKYTSDTLSGSGYVGEVRFKAIVFDL